MTNEQRAILAAWDKAVAAWRDDRHSSSYQAALFSFYMSIGQAGYDMFSYCGPGTVASGH